MGAPKKGDAHRVRSHVATMHRLAITQALREITEAWEKAGRPPGGLRGIQGRIAAQVGLDPSRVSRHLKAARAALPQAIVDQAEAIREQSRRTQEWVREQAHAAWERSLSPALRVRSNADGTQTSEAEMQGSLPEHVFYKRKRDQQHVCRRCKVAVANRADADPVCQGMPGDPRHLQVMLAAEKAIRELYGVDAPTKVAPTDPTGQKPYEPLTDEERAVRVAEILDRARRRKDE